MSVNEIWLDDSISDAAVHIPGYSIFRRDRDRHGGGVALYIQSTLPVKLLPLPSLVTAMVDSPEVLLVEIRVPNSVRDDRITVGTVYRSPAQPVGFWDGLSSAVNSIIARNEKTILLGDLKCERTRHHISPVWSPAPVLSGILFSQPCDPADTTAFRKTS